MQTCVDKAGYAKSYGYKLVEQWKNKPNLRHKVDQILNMFPEQYHAICKLRLPQIAEIEGKALDEYEKKPRLAIDKPQMLKQLKQGAGVDLGEAPPPRPVTINIGDMKLFWDSRKPQHLKKPEVINAEVIKEDKEDE